MHKDSLIARAVFTMLVVVVPALDVSQAAETPVLEDFMAGLRVRDVAISPDARYLSMIATQDGHTAVLILDRTRDKVPRPLLSAQDKEKYTPEWCGWANATRLLCGFRAIDSFRSKYYKFTRLLAINADGSNLIQITNRLSVTGGQFEDSVLDWTPEDPDTVLLEVNEGAESSMPGGNVSVAGGFADGYPEIYAVNVNTGQRKVAQRERAPIEHFVTDGHGKARLGIGYKHDEILYYGRLEGQDGWRELKRVKAMESDEDITPVAAIANSNFAYATGSDHGRLALLKIDLTDATDPVVVFSHPDVDVAAPLFTRDGRLIGVSYHTERPESYFFDPQVAAAYGALRKALPGKTISIADMTPDGKAFVVHAERDTEAGTYYVLSLNGRESRLDAVAAVAPGLAGKALAPMRSVLIPARDGASVPGYITLPVHPPAKGNPPLVVMPHGGPRARDTWGYEPWVQFLASRGYAVLQLEFRGSSGYGSAWFRAGFRDWGGVPYNDVLDATKWATAQGYGDPQRTCIVGASYGGYISLLAATRNAEKIFRCAVSISGVSDLAELRADNRFFRHWEIANASLESDVRKLRADSPRLHAADVNIPVLMVHGELDYTVEVDQTQMMDTALTRADKAHETVYVEGTDHYFQEDPARRKVLQAIADFLGRQIGVAAAP